ncbi:MAG: RHS repeat-associated core domain-containing protein [Clostridiales bacterium]|nr:RHS repeat-associated core domain-containing protein [Clostridiales bacterium]MDY4112064.1 RHS repeat-associated core domain-containing protein [Roseburia sp.]
MTSYNGQAITYDQIGNPLTYRDGMTMTWTGRQLTGITQNGQTASYKYDVDGLRLEKTANGITTEYQYVNGQLLGEKRSNGEILRYTYDPLGALSSIQYKTTAGTTTNYIVRCTLSGDVDQIFNTSGNLVARYIYDTWGNTVSVTDASGNAITSTTHIANINPIRYRGYYWDEETGFYYVSSRYYDPEICRWINADSAIGQIGNVQGTNVFAYCFNNPINTSDPTGNWPQWMKNTVKWVTKCIVKPVMKTAQKALSKVNATYSRGVNVSGTPSAFIFNLQAGISVDTKGNVAIQGSAGGGITGGSPGISITAYQSMTNAPSIGKLEGPGYQIGGSVGVPVYGVPLAAGGDFNIMPDSALNTAYLGVTTNVGFGTPGGEFHVEWGETATLNATRFNVFDVAEELYIKIMEW